MMMLPDVIRDPLAVVDSLFAASAESFAQSDAMDWGEVALLSDSAQRYRNTLSNDFSSTSSSKFCRFRGLITESRGSEFYLGVYRDERGQLRSGKYRDDVPFSSENMNTADQRVFSRDIYTLSPIPGLTPWATSIAGLPQAIIVKVADSAISPSVGQCIDFVGIMNDGYPVLHYVWGQDLDLCDGLSASEESPMVRSSLLQFMAAALGNDHLAAEYLLCHMISRVHARFDEHDILVGNFPLHLRPVDNVPCNVVVSRVRELCELLLPAVCSMTLSIDALSNSETLTPTMDYDKDVLITGPLQLAPGTSLILDQSAMSEGTLSPNGTSNLKVLQRVARSQKLAYNFMYDLDFNVDIPVIVVAEEKTTLVPTEHSVVIGGSEAIPPSLDASVEERLLQEWRLYLSTCRRITVAMNDDVSSRVQDDFAEHRCAASDMHRTLVLARLMSASLLESELSSSTWQTAFALDQERISKNVCFG